MQLPFEYLLERAARRSGVAPWAMARRPLFWMGRALAHERIDMRAQEIADKIAGARARGAKGDDEDGDDEE